MKRSERLWQAAGYGVLRALLAATLAVATAIGGYVAFLSQDALWVAAAAMGLLGFACWFGAETSEACRLMRLSAIEREDEERRRVRPRI